MAKTVAPLHSQRASGSLSKTITYGAWKGRSTVRRLTTGRNPRSPAQQLTRLRMAIANAAARWTRTTATTGPGRSSTDLELAKAAAPPGKTWNTALASALIGPDASDYAADWAAWQALPGPARLAWEISAASQVPAVQPAAPPPTA